MKHAGMYAMFTREGGFSSATQEALTPLQAYTSIPWPSSQRIKWVVRVLASRVTAR